MNKSIILLAYKRDMELRRVIRLLMEAYDFDTFHIVVVIQSGYRPVQEVLNELLPQAHLIVTDYHHSNSARQCINGNIFRGLAYAFANFQSEFTVVLEDDILVAPDFLSFCENIYSTFKHDSKFRAINGFSNILPSRHEKMQDYGYVKLNYGVGWGWALPRKTYEEISRIWNGEEDKHWDSIFEPIMRTGFVVNPVISRTLNIGFGSTASHTHSAQEKQLQGMQLGFEHLMANPLDPRVKYVNMRSRLLWRSDCVNLEFLNPIFQRLLYFAWAIGNVCFIKSKPSKTIFLFQNKLLNFSMRLARRLTNFLATKSGS